MPEILTLPDLVGLAGSVLMLLAYAAVSAGRLDAGQPPFQVLNLAGGLMMLLSLWFRPNPGAILFEVVWVLIAVLSLVRYWLARR
jgi:hypothetical protein